MPESRVERQRRGYVSGMNRPHAVPVWLKVSRDYEKDGVDWTSEEEQVDGILRLEPHGLILEFDVIQSITTMGGMDYSTDTENLGRRELDIPLDQLVAITVHRRWWLPRLRIQTSRLSAFEGLPGAKRGIVTLRIKRSNVGSAKTLIAELEFARADLALRQASLSDPGTGALPPA